MSQEVAVTIKNFTGLNVREAVQKIEDTELVDCVNYDLGRGGELIKRTGFKVQHDAATLGLNQIILVGFFHTVLHTHLIAKAGNNLYYSSDEGETWTAFPNNPWNNIEFGVQYADEFYMVRNDDTVVKWDGITDSAIVGSPSGTFCHVFKDRLFVLNAVGADGTLASRLYFSGAGDFTDWPSTNFIDVNPGDGEILDAAYDLQDVFLLFKTGSTWALYVRGDPVTWVLRGVNPKIGCISKYSVVEFEGFVYLLSASGVYRTDGSFFDNISANIQPVFENSVISAAHVDKSSAIIWDDKYILMLETFTVVPTWGSLSTKTWGQISSQTWGGQNAVYEYYVFHLRSKGWTKYKPIADVNPHTFVSVLAETSFRGLFAGERDSLGHVYKFGDEIYQDNNQDYICEFETKEYTFDLPVNFKRGKWLGLEQEGAGIHTLTNIVDKESRPSVDITGEVGKLMYKVEGPKYFRTWRFKGSALHENPLTFYGLTLQLHKKRTVVKSVT